MAFLDSQRSPDLPRRAARGRFASRVRLAVTALAAAAVCLAGCTRTRELEPERTAWRERGSGTATLSWSPLPPETYGRKAADPVVGFRIYLGRSPEGLQLEAIVQNPRATRHVVRELPRGTHYYAVTTYTRLGIESERSSVVSKNVR